MNTNVQPGTHIEVMGEMENIMVTAQWEGLTHKLGKNYFTYLMGEFYCNMKPIKGIDGILHITTIVGGKPMLVDYKSVNKALHLAKEPANLPCIDIYSLFAFNRAEFELYLSFFCDSDVPLGLIESNCGIHYKHFTPIYQTVALTLRSNVLPKPNQDKFFDFFDVKLMFLLVTNKMNFNISYVILLNMINAHLVDYMPYGLLLTSLFDIWHIPMPLELATESTCHITCSHTRTQVPLTKCEPQLSVNTKCPTVLEEEDIFLASNESVKMMIEEQKNEIKKLKAENIDILARINYLEGLTASIHGQGSMDVEIGNLYQVQMVNNDNMLDGLVAGNVMEGQNPENLSGMLIENSGYVAELNDIVDE